MTNLYELLLSVFIIRDVANINQQLRQPKTIINDVDQFTSATRTRVLHTINTRINKKVE